MKRMFLVLPAPAGMSPGRGANVEDPYKCSPRLRG